ncbi:MAG: DUF3078 domain-containing protein [Dysgonomonas sp.]
MRMYKSCFSFIAFLFVFVSLSAQTPDNTRANRDSLLNKITDIDSRLKELSIKDSTMGFSAPLIIDTAYLNRIHLENMQPLRDEKGLLLFSHEWTPFAPNITFRDTVIFDPAFLPVVFNGRILPDDVDFIRKDTTKQSPTFHLISPDSTFVPLLKRTEHIKNMRRLYYTDNPQKIRLNALAFQNTPVLKEDVVEKKNPFKELLAADNPIDVTKPDIEKIKIKPVYWLKNGDHRLQLSYNTYSDKWNGDNNFDLFSHQKFNFNYKKNKIQFNNLVEWRLQLKQITSVDDKEKPENKNKSKVNIIEDYLRTYSTFGITAFKKWSYSSNLEMKTPILTKRATDAVRTRQRAFLTPFELNLGVGMRYATEHVAKSNKYRKFNLSLDLSVLSLNYRYSHNDSIPATWFGIEEGDKAKTDYGSTYNANISYSHNRYTKFTSRIKYFTNYEKVYVECENTLDFALNNYFSTTLYFYMKFDDGVPVTSKNNDKTWGYFNYNQMIRFGLTYTW